MAAGATPGWLSTRPAREPGSSASAARGGSGAPAPGPARWANPAAPWIAPRAPAEPCRGAPAARLLHELADQLGRAQGQLFAGRQGRLDPVERRARRLLAHRVHQLRDTYRLHIDNVTLSRYGVKLSLSPLTAASSSRTSGSAGQLPPARVSGGCLCSPV